MSVLKFPLLLSRVSLIIASLFEPEREFTPKEFERPNAIYLKQWNIDFTWFRFWGEAKVFKLHGSALEK